MAERTGQVNPAPPLNRDEVALLALVAEGRTRKEIAVARAVSAGTIQHRLRVIAGKLGARTSEEAIAIAVRAGLL
jgi:DNA-binding NarL/FixJ family response regulator